MANMTVTAALVLAENNWTTSDITAINTEYLIDNAIAWLNLEAGLSDSALTGAAGSKTGSYTDTHAVLIKQLTALQIKAYLDRSPNVNAGSLSVATVLNDPQYALFMDLINRGVQQLRTRSFLRT